MDIARLGIAGVLGIMGLVGVLVGLGLGWCWIHRHWRTMPTFWIKVVIRAALRSRTLPEAEKIMAWLSAGVARAKRRGWGKQSPTP